MAATDHFSTDGYDVIIVGAGPAGLFSAYYLCEHSDLRVLVIDKGKVPQRRNCPMKANDACQRCKPCNILSGVGGAGLFSDGKLNYIYKLGKTDLSQFMSVAKAQKLIDETEIIFNRFGMDGSVYPTDMATARSIRKTAKRHGIDLLIISNSFKPDIELPGRIITWLSEDADKDAELARRIEKSYARILALKRKYLVRDDTRANEAPSPQRDGTVAAN